MIFLFIILAVCLILALQPKNSRSKNYRIQNHAGKQTRKYQEPYAKKVKTKHNPLFGPFRGTLDDDHVDIIGDQIIQHQDAEAGYVILNGVKRKIEDCKDL